MENTATLRLLTVADVAQMLNVKRSWVYGKIACNEIPHIHVGRYPRFVNEELLDWLRANHGRA